MSSRTASELVWLTDWQVAEERLLLKLGDVVSLQLHPNDREWNRRLFGDALPIAWQLDTYGLGHEERSCRPITGLVLAIWVVHCPLILDDEGWGPAPGQASLEPATDTSRSWARSPQRRPKFGEDPAGWVAAVVPLE
ncbi:MAG: DUF6578 domain-containing protein [Glaciihabitans sp.]